MDSPTATMRLLMRRGVRSAAQRKHPPQGTFFHLFDKYTKKYKYQVEFINDKRMYSKPYVAVYCFKDPKDLCVRSFDFALYSFDSTIYVPKAL